MIWICDDKLLIFHLLLFMSVSACETSEILTFTAHERGKVEIQCSYESKYKEDKKYLCRGECPRGIFKDKPVESESAAEDKRFSLNDNKTAHIFTVTITDLTTEDQGQYWCGVKTGWLRQDSKREIYLEIKNVPRVPGVKGEHLNISCRFENELKDSVKFICKASNTSLCEKSIKVSSEKNSNGRFSLRDNTSAGVFTVTIADLTEEDSGIYWCGAVQRGQGQKNKWISVFDLNITAVTSEKMSLKPTTTASLQTSKPATADTASDRTGTSLSLSSSSSSSSASTSVFFSLTANAMSAKPQTSFTPIIIMVMVLGILTGFGFSLFVYLRQIRKEKGQKEEGTQPKDVVHGPTRNLPSGDTRETREATHTVYDYEDISTLDHPDYTLVLPAFAEHDASVYALAQLPSSPSDTLYSSIRFTATHRSDRTSDGQETCHYATVRPKD